MRCNKKVLLARAHAALTHHGTHGHHATLISARKRAQHAARMLTTRDTQPITTQKCYNHVLSRVPLLSCGARICGSVLASCSGASQQEHLLPDGSCSRRSSKWSIRSTSRPSAPAPFNPQRIEDAGQLGVHVCGTFCIMSISRFCTRQHTRQYSGTGRWRRQAAPAPFNQAP